MDDLQKENAELKAKLKKYDRIDKTRKSFLKFMIKVFVGKDVKNSTTLLVEELYKKKLPSRETLSDFISALLYRLTRFGFVAFLLALLPSIILVFQLYFMREQKEIMKRQEVIMDLQRKAQIIQNDYIKLQNSRLEDQTYLQEADRRSSLMLVFNSIIESINEELINKKNNNRELSDQLIGSIISLSARLKPYRYFEDGKLIDRKLSPERGQLLITILNSRLGDKTLYKIIKDGNFQYSELYNTDFSNKNLSGIDLSYAKINDCSFHGTNLESSIFYKAAILNTTFYNSILYFSDLRAGSLNAKFDGSMLHRVFIDTSQWSVNEGVGDLGLKQIRANYLISDETDKYFFSLKPESDYEKFSSCEKIVLDIIESNKYVKELELSLIKPAKLILSLRNDRQVSDSMFIDLHNQHWEFDLYGDSEFNGIMSRVGSVVFKGDEKRIFIYDGQSDKPIKVKANSKLISKYIEVCLK